MKILITVLSILSSLLLLSTLICGLWIKSNPNLFTTVEKLNESLGFHLWIAVASIGLTLVTFILAVITLLKSA
jgi:hypothetical protein